MADENKVDIELEVDSSKATRSLDEFEKSATKSISNISSSFKALSAVAAAAVAFVAGKGLVDFFASSADAAAKNESEVAKLEASLKSLGEFTPEVVQDFKDFADQIESSSKFSDDAVISQIAFAKQLDLTNEQTKKLIQGAAGLASFMGSSLDSAVDLVSKSLTGQVGALKKVVHETAAFTEEQNKAGASLDLVFEKYKNVAKDAIQTYSGALNQADNAQDDFKKSIGSIITQNPVVIEAIKAVTDGLGKLQEIVDQNKEQITEYTTVVLKLAVNTIPTLVEGLGAFVSIMKVVTKGLAALTAVTADAISGFLQFETIQTIISAAFQSVTVSISAFIKLMAALIDGISKLPGASEAFDAFGISIEDVQKSLEDTSDTFNELSKNPIDFKETIDGLNKIRDDAVDFGNTAEDVFSGAEDGIAAVGKVARDTAAKISAADGEVAKAAKAAGIAQEVAGQAAVKASVDASRAKAKALEDEKENAKIREKLAADAESFIDRVFSKESSGLKKIEIERKRDLDKLQEFQDAGVIATETAEALRTAIIEDAAQKQLDIRKKKLEDFKKDISDITTNPIKLFISEIDIDTDALKGIGNAIASGVGALGTILKGKTGAEDLVKNAASALGDALIPGIGAAVGEITAVLAQGPAAVKGFIDDFVNSLPAIITNIAESIPVVLTSILKAVPKLIDGLLKSMPEIIKAIVDGIPDIISALVDSVPDVIKALVDGIPEIILALLDSIPKIITALVDGMIEVADTLVAAVPEIIDGLVKAVPKLIQAIVRAIPAVVTALVDGIPRVITTFVNSIPRIVQALADGIPQIVQALVDGIPEIIHALVVAAPQVITALSDALPEIITALSAAMPQVATALAEAMPQVVVALAQSGPAIANGLIDELVFKGGAVKIGVAIVKSMSDPSILTAAGKSLSLSFLSSITGVDIFGPAFKSISKSISDTFAGVQKMFTDTFNWVERVFNSVIKAFTDTFNWVERVFTFIVKMFTDTFSLVERIFDSIYNAVFKPFVDAVNALTGVKIGGGGGSAGDILTTIATGGANKIKLPKFAGGGLVGPGFENDGLLARVGSKEMILPADLSTGLQDLIRSGGSRQTDDQSTVAMLSQLGKIAALLAQPMNVSTTAEVDGRALAQIILQLSRQNARLTA